MEIILIPYCFAVMPCSLLRPPSPYFSVNFLYRVVLPPSHVPLPPVGHSNRFAVLHFLHLYACCMCRRVVLMIMYVSSIISLRTGLGLFHWSWTVFRGQWFCKSSCHEDYRLCFAEKWQHVHGQQLFHPSILPRHVDWRSPHLLPYNRASFISVRECVGGGLNYEAKAQVIVVTPSPLFFLEVMDHDSMLPRKRIPVLTAYLRSRQKRCSNQPSVAPSCCNQPSQSTAHTPSQGGVNYETKAHVLVVTPSPLFFLEVTDHDSMLPLQCCRREEFSSSTAQQSFVHLNTRMPGRGSLTTRWKRKSTRRAQKGGGVIVEVRYMYDE